MATGAAAAHADTTMISNDNVGILNGTQVYAPIQAPINLCGAAVSVAGQAVAGCEGGSAASIKDMYDVKMLSTDNTGVLNGTQIFMPVQIPVNVCGVAVAVLGGAGAHCEGGSSATLGNGGGHHHHYKKPKTSVPRTESTGDEEGKPCTGCPTTPPKPEPPKPQPPAQECPPKHHHHHHHGKDVTMLTKHNVGILNGTQVYAPIQAPVNISSVSAGVLGNAWSWSDGGSSARM